MSDKSNKKERRRSSSSSSFSSTSSEGGNDVRVKTQEKIKERPRPANPVGNVSKMRLDIGYKIQQEELSDSDDSTVNSALPKASKGSDVINYSVEKKRERSKSSERRRYRSRSNERRKERSPSKDSRKDRSQSKDIRHELKSSSKYDIKSLDRKDGSKSKEKKRERSRSRDRRKRSSRSRDKKFSKSPSRERKRGRSRSREKRRDRSRSKDKKEKRRERSRSREKQREKPRRDSGSPSYYRDRNHSRRRSRDKSRERSSKRSRSRSRPRKRSRSRSRSFDRSKRLHEKKLQKLNILEKLGIELKVPEGQVLGEGGPNAPGFSIPSYYNPAGVNPLKYAQQMQKRKLIWGSKKLEGESSTEKKEEEKKPEAGPESVWKGTTFSQDQDGKLTAKFKRLMGIKDGGEEEGSSSSKNSELIQKQEEMFNSMEKQYEVARVSTHTHRGLGLGFGVHLPR